MALFKIFRRDVSKQFIKFCLVGLEKTIFSYLIFILFLYFLFFDYISAAFFGAVAGVLFGFGFDKIYTFNSDKKIPLTLIKYFIIYTISVIILTLLMRAFVENLNFHPLLSYLIIEPIIIAINFFGTKIWVFKNKYW